MIDVAPKKLKEDTDVAMREAKDRLDSLPGMVERYTGRFRKKGQSKADYDPENYSYQYLTLTMADQVANNPKALVRSKAGDDAQALEYKEALDQWVKDVDLRVKLRESYVAYHFKYAAVAMSMEKTPGSDEDYRPCVEPLALGFFGRDPLALSFEKCRYLCHEEIHDKQDLIDAAEKEPEAWNVEVVKSLVESVGVKDLRGEMQGSPDRKEVVIRKVWVKDYKLPPEDKAWSRVPEEDHEFCHGTIFTLGIAQQGTLDEKSDFVRPPMPHFGPRWGPYYVAEYLPVPNDPYGLSHADAVEGQVRELNDVARAERDGNMSAKNIGVIAQKDEAAAQIIENTPNGRIAKVNVDDIGRAVAALALGGAPDTVPIYRERVRNNLERTGGMTDFQQGQITGGTATEVAQAAGGSSMRAAGSKQQFYEFTARLMQGAAWFMEHDERYRAYGSAGRKVLGGKPSKHRAELVAEAKRRGMDEETAKATVEAALVKADAEWDARRIEDFEISVEPGSMDHVSDQMRLQKAMALSPLVFNAVQLEAVNPHFESGLYLKWLAGLADMPEIETFIDEGKGEEVQAINLAAEQGQPEGQAGPRPTGPGVQSGTPIGPNSGRSSPNSGQTPTRSVGVGA